MSKYLKTTTYGLTSWQPLSSTALQKLSWLTLQSRSHRQKTWFNGSRISCQNV